MLRKLLFIGIAAGAIMLSPGANAGCKVNGQPCPCYKKEGHCVPNYHSNDADNYVCDCESVILG